MTQYLFSYGTLQHEKVQVELFGRLLSGTKDIVPGYRVSTIEILGSFPAKEEKNQYLIAHLSANSNDKIEGTVYEVTEEELVIADQYEPPEYKRVQVMLQSGKAAWIYTSV